ncbi:MAG: DinB family protein [Bacilli bacterium]
MFDSIPASRAKNDENKISTGEILRHAIAREIHHMGQLPVCARNRRGVHIGSYAAEEPTIAKLHSFIEEKGYRLNGKHHEIYLSDPRKSAPEKLKTILRQPAQK